MGSDNLEIILGFIHNKEITEKLQRSKDRIRKSFEELFAGYKLNAEHVLNEVVQVSDYTGVVEVKNISFYSFCEHHFAPFFGTCSVVYEPNGIITGLGKIIRLVREVHARRLQIQEIMTKDIAEDLLRVIDAKGVFVSTIAKHLCTCSRGPGDDLAESVVEYGVGTLKGWGRREF